MPTIAARIRRPSSIRKKSLLAIFALLGAGVVVGCIAVLSVFEFKSRAGQSQPTPEMELVKRQFQGGGLMGDTPVEVSRFSLACIHIEDEDSGLMASPACRLCPQFRTSCSARCHSLW